MPGDWIPGYKPNSKAPEEQEVFRSKKRGKT